MKELSLPLIDLKACGVNLAEDDIIGFPAESRVYRGNGLAVKVYQYAQASGYKDIAIPQILRYKEVVDQAEVVLEEIEDSISENGKVTWEVVPILAVGQEKYGGSVVPCTVSPYVPGDNLMECEDEVEARLQELGVEVTLDDMLENVTSRFREAIGERGIKVVKHNVKPRITDDGLHMRITDISAEVKYLTYSSC